MPCYSHTSTMSALKRKREDDDERGVASLDTAARPVADAAMEASDESPVAQAPLPNGSGEQAPLPASAGGDSTGGGQEASAVTASTAAAAAGPESSSASGASGPVNIVICGEEVVLKGTAGRRKRKQPVDALIALAYKGRLARASKSNDMVSALEVYREMKAKGVKQDLSVSASSLSREKRLLWFPRFVILASCVFFCSSHDTISGAMGHGSSRCACKLPLSK